MLSAGRDHGHAGGTVFTKGPGVGLGSVVQSLVNVGAAVLGALQSVQIQQGTHRLDAAALLAQDGSVQGAVKGKAVRLGFHVGLQLGQLGLVFLGLLLTFKGFQAVLGGLELGVCVVQLGLQGSGLTDAEIRARVEDTLKVCGLYPFRNWPISALSFGQKKRVTIASVLVQDPELIILDEPTAGQDFRHYTDIMEFLRGLNAKGVTVVMITHDMHLMLEYTPRALAFCDGRLIADRSAAAILCDPALIEQAALKETSLYTLANRCGITPAEEFVERFIAADREVRADGC